MTDRRKLRNTDNDMPFGDIGKIPPHAVDLEEFVLGGVLLDDQSKRDTIGHLPVEAFYKRENKLIWKAICDLAKSDTIVDIATLRTQLKKNGDLDSVGGPYYISTLTDRMTSSANVAAYVKILLEAYTKREAIRISSFIIGQAYEETTDVFDLMDEVGGFHSTLTKALGLDIHIQSMESIAEAVIRQFKERISGGVDDKLAIGHKTYFPSVDDVITCFDKGEYICIAGRPGMGKTTFALQIALNNAEHGIPVAFLTAEMTAEQLMVRLASISLPHINGGKFRKVNELTEEEQKEVYAEIRRISQLPIKIIGCHGMNYMQLGTTMTNLAEEGYLMQVIDYIGLFHGDKHTYNANDRITKVSNTIMLKTKKHGLSSIVLSQLSREVEKRSDKKPMLSDLRESGAIEQDADIVIFPWRPGYYDIEHDKYQNYIGDKMFILIDKFRSGAAKDIKLNWSSRSGIAVDPNIEVKFDEEAF